jgi:tetratricopeptide (TPR) repeat protein
MIIDPYFIKTVVSMRNYTLLIFLFCSLTTVFSQEEKKNHVIDNPATLILLEEAKHYYTEGKTLEALNLFRSIEAKDDDSPNVKYWISLCYYRLNNYTLALNYARKTLHLDSKPSGEFYELLGRCYHQNAQVDSAIYFYTKSLDELSKLRAEELNILKKIDECKFALSEYRSSKPNARKLLNVEVNSEFNEYAPILTQGGKTLYFAARRNNTTGGLKNPDDEQYFEDIYRAKWNDTYHTWDSITNQLGKLNGDGFEAFTFINSDATKALLTLNTTALDIDATTESSDICEVEIKNGVWSKPKTIANESINTSYYDGAATMSADGNTMIFVSDREGEKSSTDLYIVRKIGKKWGEATPLPMNVNTKGRETTPYLTPDGKYLFFSSDGHKGMGGYDIYVTQNYGTSWSTPINLGSSINTVNDDTHFQYYPELKRALMAGITLDEMQCNYNIYEIDLEKVQLPLK